MEAQRMNSDAVGRENLLTIDRITKDFVTPKGMTFNAVAEVSFTVAEHEVVGLVGPSGSGKSTLALIIAGLLKPTSGSVVFMGKRLDVLKPAELRGLRHHLQIAFQHSKGVLDPFMSVQELVEEPFRIHGIDGAMGRAAAAAALLEQVGLSALERQKYPGQISGGQYQRVIIARALATRPRLVILDEPVSALDVSVQGQILNLLMDLRRAHGLAYILISHDTGVIQHMCEKSVPLGTCSVVR